MQPQPHQVHIVGPGNWTSQQVPAGHIVQGAPRPSFQGAPVVLHPRPSYAGAPPPTRGSFMQPVGHPQQAPPPPHQQPQPQQGAGAPVPPQQRGAVAGGPPPPTTGPPIRSGPPAELRRSLSKLPPFPVCPTGQWRTMHMENEQRMVELESRSSGRRSRRRGRQGQLVEEETIYMNQSNRIVVRVRDRLTGKTFVLKKVVTPCEAHLTPEECLEQGSKDLHEVRVMVNMDHPNVVKVYEAWLDVERPERRSAWFLQWLAIQAEAGVRGYVHAATSMMRGQGHPHQLPQGGDANKGKPKGQAPDMYKLHYTVLYILMEDCKGGSLEDLLKQSPEGLHSEGVLHKLLVQSASAFAFLALNDMVHKDVKTLNVFLDSQINVRVGDFGSAVTMISGRTEAMGEMTELFIAPEFFRGEQHLNEKFDVFALGLVFLRLVCGSALQVGVPQGVLGFGRAIAMNPQIRIEEMDEYLSSGTPLARIILHMLDPNPATRWSAEQVFDHLVLYQPQTLLTPHRGPPVQSNSRSAGIHDVLLPPPDAVRDYNSCYRLYEDVDDQPGMSMWRRMCSWRSMMWTLLGWIMFGALIFLLAFVTRDRIEEGFDREDVGYDVDQTSLIMGATFIASLGAAVLFTFLLRIFHFAPSLIYYGIYLITLLAGVYCANVFRENDNGVFAVAAISYAAVKLWFVLVRNVQRNFNLQRPIVLYVTRYLMFSHMGKARRLFVLSLLVAVLQFAVLGFGALFFLENPTDVARIASLLPFLWLLSIMRNVLHYVAAFVFHNQVTPHQSKFRHPVQIGLTHALTLHFAPIIVASVFTTLQPFFSTFLRVADALFIMGQYAGCYWRYQVDDDRDHPWSDSEHDQPQSVPLAEAPKGDEQNGGNHLAPPKKGDPVGSSPPRSPSPGHSPAPPKDAPAEAMTVPVGSIFQPSANPFDPDPQRHAPPRGVSDPGNASSAPSGGGGGGAHHKQRQGVYKSQTGSQASELCCINWLCTGPALALQFIGRPAKLGYKLIVTIMGYYGLGFKPSLRWMRKRAGVLHLQGDEVLDNYFSNVAVLAGFAAVIVADLYEEQVAAFAFLVAYATFRVAVEPAVATITAAWISSLSGETKEEVFDRILVETNQAIEREMLLLSRRSHDRHAGRITRM